MRRLLAFIGVWLLLGGIAEAQSGLPVQCTVTVSTATTLTAVGGQCAAGDTQLALYITDIAFATNAGAIAADSFNTLKYGSGSACGTGTITLWSAMTVAATQTTVIQSFRSPLRVPADKDLCWINSTAGSKALVITGYRAP
jgi:hypothetical protein